MALSDLQKMVVGMFNPGQAPANASIYDLARADAQRQALAQLGMGLVGAAVPQTPTMRAQALQQALASVGNIGTNTYNSAQARLMAQRAEADIARQKASQAFYGQTFAPASTQPIVQPAEPVGEFREIPTAARRLIQPTPPTATPATPSFPGGLNKAQWESVSSLAQKGDVEAADQLFARLVAKNAEGAGAGEDTYGSILFITDEATGLPQAVLPKKGGGYVPIAPPGQVITPDQLAGLKASETEKGKLGAQEQAGAPDAIAQAELNLQNIDTLLEGDAIDLAYGSVYGALDPTSGPGIAYNLSTGGKFGAAVALVDQIDFGSFAEGIKLFTGKGALSDAEGKVARGIKARLVRTQDPASARQALMEFRAIVEVGKRRSELLNQKNPATGKPYTKAEAFAAVPALDAELGKQKPTPSPKAPEVPLSIDSNDPLGIR